MAAAAGWLSAAGGCGGRLALGSRLALGCRLALSGMWLRLQVGLGGRWLSAEDGRGGNRPLRMVIALPMDGRYSIWSRRWGGRACDAMTSQNLHKL